MLPFNGVILGVNGVVVFGQIKRKSSRIIGFLSSNIRIYKGLQFEPGIIVYIVEKTIDPSKPFTGYDILAY